MIIKQIQCQHGAAGALQLPCPAHYRQRPAGRQVQRLSLLMWDEHQFRVARSARLPGGIRPRELQQSRRAVEPVTARALTPHWGALTGGSASRRSSTRPVMWCRPPPAAELSSRPAARRVRHVAVVDQRHQRAERPNHDRIDPDRSNLFLPRVIKRFNQRHPHMARDPFAIMDTSDEDGMRTAMSRILRFGVATTVV